MAAITAALFVPAIISTIMMARLDIHPPLEPIRRFAPLGLFAFTIGALLFSAGEQALYYTPAEVTFLFSGPYRKRQLLAYKMVLTVLLCLFGSFFFTMGSKVISPHLYSAMLGSFVFLLFLQVLQMAVGLAASTLGALAWSRGRRWIVISVFVLTGAALFSVGGDLRGPGVLEVLQRVEKSSIISAVMVPFRWFVLAFTAERIWPDLIHWLTLSLAIDAGLIALVFALDASYLEAASGLSARRFSKLQRLGGGGGIRSVSSHRVGWFRFRPPMAPWWGGVGPNLWRQMTSALGDPVRMASVLVLLSLVPLLMMILIPRDSPRAEPLPYVCMGTIAWMSIILSLLLPFDFRGDIDMMEELKALPIKPSRMALGQILTPMLIATFSQAVAMLLVIQGLNGGGLVGWSVLVFLAPVNLLFYAIENLLFLWYPTRIVAGQFDVLAIGRQVIFMLAKVIGLGLGIALSAVFGAIGYFVTGRNIGPALVLGWIALMASALSLLPLLGLAFRNFDVARDLPA